MKLSPRDKRALVICAVALIVMFGYLGASPWLESWARAREHIDQASARQTALRQKIDKLTLKQKQLGQVYGQAIEQPLPGVDQARIRFVDMVEQVMSRAGVQSKTVRAQPARVLREVPGVSVVGLEVSASGDFRKIAQCLAEMTRAPYPIFVDRLTLATDSQNRRKMSLSMIVGTFAKGAGP